MCGRSKQSSAVTVPVTATAQTSVLNYKESVVMGSFAVSVCCALVSLPEGRVRCHDCWCGAFVFARTHMCVANAKSSWSSLGLW